MHETGLVNTMPLLRPCIQRFATRCASVGDERTPRRLFVFVECCCKAFLSEVEKTKLPCYNNFRHGFFGEPSYCDYIVLFSKLLPHLRFALIIENALGTVGRDRAAEDMFGYERISYDFS